MFAITAARLNPDDPLSGLELGEHADPKPPDGWEIVQVRAASVNHHDLWALQGIGLAEDSLPMILGSDAAGVTTDGREVLIHSVLSDPGEAGDETLAADFHMLSEQVDGTHAELLAVPSRNLIDKPRELSFAEAASLPTAWLTAYRMLFTKARLRPGQRVLIQGAGGGVATAALILARAAGLHVFVTSRDEDKRQRAAEYGAHEVFEAGARLPERVDAVLETVGQATWKHSLRSLAPGGILVVAGATSGPNPPAELQRVFIRQLQILGSTMGTREELVALTRMVVDTGIRPVIDSEHPLDRGRNAYERLHAGDVFGKVILTTS